MIHPKIALSFVSLLPVFALHAQQPTKGTSPAVPVVATKAMAVDADTLLASWLLATSDGEMASARIAVRRAQSPEVKQFAQGLIDAHQKLAGELRPFAAEAAAKPAKAAGDAVEASSSSKSEPQGPFDHLALIRDLSQRCAAEQEKALDAVTLVDFDRTFLQGQVRAHQHAVIMAEVFRSRASSELRPTLEKTGTALRAHLEQAKTLCKKVDEAPAIGKSGKQQ